MGKAMETMEPSRATVEASSATVEASDATAAAVETGSDAAGGGWDDGRLRADAVPEVLAPLPFLRLPSPAAAVAPIRRGSEGAEENSSNPSERTFHYADLPPSLLSVPAPPESWGRPEQREEERFSHAARVESTRVPTTTMEALRAASRLWSTSTPRRRAFLEQDLFVQTLRELRYWHTASPATRACAEQCAAREIYERLLLT